MRRVALGAGLVAAGVLGVGWAIARRLTAPSTRRYDLIVRDVEYDGDACVIVLDRTRQTAAEGAYNLWFENGGWAQLSEDVLDRGATLIARRVTSTASGLTVRAGDYVSWSGIYYATPHDASLHAHDITIDTPAGPAPAWRIDGDGARSTWAIHLHGLGSVRAGTLRGVLAATERGYTSLVISYRTDGERLAHTERGSMIFPVLLLLDEPPEDKAEPLDGFDSITPESDQRRVTRTLAEALSLYNRTVIQKAVEPKAVDMGPLIAAGGSREMFRQVQQVLRDPELGVLDIGFAWAAVEQPRGQAVERVGIPSDAIDLVDRTVQLLSKMEPRPRSIVTGPIYTISHATDGPVHIAIQTAGLNGHLQKVELTVSADRRSDLHKWMDAGITVTASGRIQTQPGMPARLLDVDGPVPLDETIFQGE